MKANELPNYIIEPEKETTLKNFLETNKRYPIIAITWPAGVGKSTITNLIASYLWAAIYTELPAYNPFLKIIKETKWKVNDTCLWLNNQNFFLATDVGEITKAFIESSKKPIVFDFALTQSYIFSDIKLTWSNLKTFNEMFEAQFETLPKPDIVIEVQADAEVIINRLSNRWAHIDDFVINMTRKINEYYKNGIVNEFYEWKDWLWAKVIPFDNNKNEPNKKLILDRVIEVLEQKAA